MFNSMLCFVLFFLKNHNAFEIFENFACLALLLKLLNAAKKKIKTKARGKYQRFTFTTTTVPYTITTIRT